MRCLARSLGLLAAFAAIGLPATLASAAETLVVTQQSIADEKAVFATVESVSVVPARGRIGGTVVQLKVREGDRVAAGQAIATIGDDKLVLQMKSLDAQIEALQAQANQAQLDFSRTEGLVERGILPVGSVVLAGDPIVTVAQQNFKLRLRVPERHARFLKAGDRIRVDGAEFVGEVAKSGVIDLVYPQIEEGRVIADATVEGLGEYFVGDRLRVWISGGTRAAFVIPSSYVTTRFGIDYVRLQKDKGTIDVPVQRGRELPTPALPDGLEILSGISAGDQLVLP